MSRGTQRDGKRPKRPKDKALVGVCIYGACERGGKGKNIEMGWLERQKMRSEKVQEIAEEIWWSLHLKMYSVILDEDDLKSGEKNVGKGKSNWRVY